MKKRIAVVACLCLLTGAALAVGMPAGQSQGPNINLKSMTISQKEGPPGIVVNIHIDPAEAQAVCLNTAEAQQKLVDQAQFLTSPAQVGNLAGNATALLNSVAQGQGALHSVGLIYAVAFADLETQAPLATNAPTGWDPTTGNGSILIPNAPRPKLYAIAAVCLGLRAITPDEANAALAGVDPTAPDAALAALLGASVNQDPIGTGFAIFCLTDGGGCPAEAVNAQARTTG